MAGVSDFCRESDDETEGNGSLGGANAGAGSLSACSACLNTVVGGGLAKGVVETGRG